MKNNEGIIKKFIKKENNLNEYRATQEYQEIHKFSDIEEEFVFYIENGWKEETKLLKVEGYHAKQLFENYSLSILGAYNYLVYLREDPVHAIDFLNKGLPRG